MKPTYATYECGCGWFCLVLEEARVTVYHCGKSCSKKPGGKKEGT